MRAPLAAGCVMLAFVASTSACVRTSAFACGSDDDCVDAGVAGACEPTGFCSFPDASCPSHQRYGDHAGDGLGGACVPEDGTTSGEPTSAGSTGTHDATSAASLDTTPLSVGSESSSTTPVTSLETSTSVDDTTGDPTDATSSSTSGGVVPQCPSFVDDFEDAAIDPSWLLMDDGYVSEAGGALVFELTPDTDLVYPGVLRMDQDLASGYVRMHVGDAPLGDGERLYLAVAIDPDYADVVYIMIEGPLVRMQREQQGMEWVTYADLQYDAMAHAWLQIRGENGTVFFETSSDGETFEAQASADDVFELLNTTVVVAGTNYLVLPETGYVSIRDFEICNGA